MTIYVGGDLASRSGIAYGRADTTPAVEVVQAPVCGDDLGRWGAFWWRYFHGLLTKLCDRLDPGEDILVAYEAPVVIEKTWDAEKGRMVGGNPLVTTRKLQGLGLIFETVCHVVAEERGVVIDVRECHLSTIKKALTGNGRADKSALVLVARRCGINLPSGKAAYDGADGFGAWILAVRLHAPREHADAWDRRIHSGPRGQERLSAREARELLGRR